MNFIKGFWKTGFIFVTIVLFVIAALGAYLYGKGSLSFQGLKSFPSPTVFLATPAAKPGLGDEMDAIKEAVYTKTGLNEKKAEVSVNKFTGEFAMGNIKEFDAVGGAYWIAAKVGGKWICVYDGQASPSCKLIDPYNFPKEMVPQCLDSKGKVIGR